MEAMGKRDRGRRKKWNRNNLIVWTIRRKRIGKKRK